MAIIKFKQIFSKLNPIKKKEPGMQFKVGENLNQAQTERAQEIVRTPSGVKEDPIRSFITPFPRLVGNFAAEIKGQPINPRGPAKYLFGDEPILPMSKRFDESEEKYGKYGPLVVGATSILDALDPLPGGKGGSKVVKRKLERELAGIAEKKIAKKTLTKLGEKEVQKNEERFIIRELSKRLPKLHDAVNTGRGSISEWAEADRIMKRIDAGTDSAEDFVRAKQLLAKNSGFERKLITDPVFTKRPIRNTADELVNNPEAGFAKIPTREELKESSQTVRTQLYDRLAPLEDLTKGKVAFDKDPYPAARLFAGVFGKAQNKLDELGGILRINKKKLADIKQYAKLEREIEKAGQGVKEFEGGRTIDQIKAEITEFEKRTDMGEIKRGVAQVRSYSDKLLTELQESGVLSLEQVGSIRAKNQKYIPFDRLEYIAKEADKLPAGTHSFNVAKNNVIKTLIGSKKEIADPIESLVRKTYAITSLAERNKVALKVADLANDPQFKGVVEKIEGEVPDGMEKLSVFRNGVKEEYAVPKAVGEALKGLNAGEADIVTNIMSKISTGVLRSGATGLNIAFLPANMIRDFQSALFVSKVGFNPIDWMKGFYEAIARGEDYKKFVEAGGSYSGFFEGNKALPKTVGRIMESKLSRAVKSIINPVELIRKAGETIELAPRLGVFKKSLGKGKSAAEAAFNAREATVDFSKTGSTMATINKWVPFLNANIQGKANVFKAFRDRPVRSAFLTTTLIAAPTIATYMHNTKHFPEVWNDISQYEKDNNILIIYGDERDEDGKYSQVVKIPKADVSKVFGNITENVLAYMQKNNPKSFQDLAVQVVSDASPIGFERDGNFSLNQVLSSTTPPIIKAGVETATNKNLYTGYDIVPKSMEDASPRNQYKENTSKAARFIGDKLNVSPLKVENFAGTWAGGVGRQVLDPKQVGTQTAGRFSGARGGEEERRAQEEAESFMTEQADRKLELKRQAKTELNRIESSGNPSETFAEIKKANPDLAEAIATEKDAKDLNYTSLDYDIKSLGVDNGQRARFLLQQFNKLKTPEEKAAYWEELTTKKLLSKRVQEQIKYLLKEANN